MYHGIYARDLDIIKYNPKKSIEMTKFLVIKGYENKPALSIVAFATDSEKDATGYADIMNRNENDPDYTYYVAEVNKI